VGGLRRGSTSGGCATFMAPVTTVGGEVVGGPLVEEEEVRMTQLGDA
jgi:hypothetical protein